MVKYIIDANILIQAYRKYYTLDVFVSFWEKIKHLADTEVICSIDKVKNEIIPNGDDLSLWCIKQLPSSFFINSSSFIVEYSTVIRSVSNLNKYTKSAISEFSDSNIADAFLVASAMSLSVVDKYVLVTEEVSDPRRIKRVKIPDVCSMFNVRWINTIEMFKELNIRI